jgi:hypothetical protein
MMLHLILGSAALMAAIFIVGLLLARHEAAAGAMVP